MAFGDDIKARLRAAGRTQNDLADKLNMSATALSRIIKDQRKDVGAKEIQAIEAALLELEGATPRPAGLIPLLGYAAAGGDDRISWSFDHAIDWVQAPPVRDGSRDIVGIRISGDSMEPRLFSGETIYVGLGLQPARGGDSVIEFVDGTALVKSYNGRRDGYVFARQYNPDKELRFNETAIRAVHAVIWRR